MKQIIIIALALLCSATAAGREDGPEHRKLTGVPFTEVKIRDGFWAPRIEINREKSLPHNFKWCRQTGRFGNFVRSAAHRDGRFEGIYFNDSDVYKVLEGASYALADLPDPVLEAAVDEVVAWIAAAQEENGYLNTFYTLAEPDKRWSDLRIKHELYCAGHLIEGAVAHFRATGKRTLLDVAIRFADRIDALFGPGKRQGVPGHEEIELALVKLYQVTGDSRYMKLSQFFLESRGNKEKRPLFGAYCQDHALIADQSEIVGHAVRAMYLYAGVADVAAYTGHRPWIDAMERIWKDVVEKKMYITGGIGARHSGEAFGAAYELPNQSAYAETCAAIGLALFAHRLNLMHGDARYADVLERVIYNGILSGIGRDGTSFFYVNPLASGGGHHRQPFYPCACCPSNVVRFVPSLPGYVYALGPEGIHVNLYVAGKATIQLDEAAVTIVQRTRYPWDGHVQLKLELEKPAAFDMNLRIPGWCRGARILLNDLPIRLPEIRSGYARLHRTWQSGDRIELNMPMPVERIEAHRSVEANAGRVALQRGPLVYCFEGADNGSSIRRIRLAREPGFSVLHKPDLLGGITVIRCRDVKGRTCQAVPYHAWDHREPGPMAVWVRQDGKSRSPDADDPAWNGILYRSLDPRALGPSTPLSPAELMTASASHCHASDAADAMNDEIEPKSSGDHGLPRFTWWDHRGTEEWVQYDFDTPRKVSAMEVYWFDDTGRGQCRVPESWRLLYEENGQWKPVKTSSAFGVELDRFNRVEFATVSTAAVRIEVKLKTGYSGGVLEWKVE